ncbi:hypothetical protein CPB83DRAFT_309265 [Crepidotus variabilis]|uniref:Uncharacterized protein n=1 Tax=Crepidotus variabilis TaxID=179855 RepID=A0A9P6JPZ8_9AGAR|nr:hypothetical protein CPB83DRAFT_309265 [Crepidotus variabilis]
MGCCGSKPSVETLVKDAQKSLSEFAAAQEAANFEEANRALERAVSQYGEAFVKARDEHHASYIGISINYASTLDTYTSTTGKTAEHTAIVVLSGVRNEFKDQAKKPILYPTLLNTLATAHLNQYHEPGNAVNKNQVLKLAGTFFDEVRTVIPDAVSNSQYSRSLIGSATVLCLECERPGEEKAPQHSKKSSDAIELLGQVHVEYREQYPFEYYRQLATAHDMRFRQTRTTIDESRTMSDSSLEDLAKAIEYNTTILASASNAGDKAACLIDLGNQEFEKLVRTQTPNESNLREVEKHMTEAEDLLQQLDSDPTNLRSLCDTLKANITNYRNRRPTLDYGRTMPARRQSTTTSVTSTPRPVGKGPQTILEGEAEVAEPGTI